MNYAVILAVASVAAGIINGLIGTGGGIILYFALKLTQKLNKSNSSSISIKDIMANTIAVAVPMSVVSAVIYIIKGNVVYSELVKYLPAAVIGGIAGAVFLNKMKPWFVKKLFAVMVIYAGIRMFMK